MEQGWNISFHSRIQLDNGGFVHLPMLDFAMHKSAENLETISETMSEVIIPAYGGGSIVETNNSYHFFGIGQLTDEEQYVFLGTALLLNHVHQNGIRIVDERWIGRCLQLRKGAADLRISGKNGRPTPFVVKRL